MESNLDLTDVGLRFKQFPSSKLARLDSPALLDWYYWRVEEESGSRFADMCTIYTYGAFSLANSYLMSGECNPEW